MTTKINKRAAKLLASCGYPANPQSPIALLVQYAAQNSGLDMRNYYTHGDQRPGAWREGYKAYRDEQRGIGADWKRVKAALQQAVIDGVTDADVLEAAPRAFSGRLEWKAGTWAYCTGQYWPTEYRKAVASVLEAAARQRRASRPSVKRMPTSIDELKHLNRVNGGCWFEPSTMRFFGTRIESGVLAGKYFLTSEQPPHGCRAFSIRSFDDQGEVDTVGEFCKLGSRAEAMEALTKHLTMARAAEAVPA